MADLEIAEVLMGQSVLYGIIIVFGSVAVNGVGITTFLLGEHLHSHKTGPSAVNEQKKVRYKTKNHLTDSVGRVE